MKSSPTSNLGTTELSIAQVAMAPFRWGWDSSHYFSLMWSYHLQLLKQIHLMSIPKLTGLTASLSAFRTSTSRSMTYWTEPMLNTISVMIKIECHTSSKWATKFSYICRRSASLGPAAIFAHSDMGCTPSPRL